MPTRSTTETSERLRQRLDQFFDVVARLLAKRWQREQQDEMKLDDTSDLGSEVNAKRSKRKD